MLTEEDFQRLDTFVKPTKLSCVPWSDAVREGIQRYQELKESGAPPGLFVGFEKFDIATGGLKKGSLTILVAETGGCKSTVATNIMRHVAVEKGKPVACFSYEMMQEEFVDMIYSICARVDRNKFNTGNFNDWDLERMANATEKVGAAPLYVFDIPSTIEELEEACTQLHAGIPLELVVVDYLQLIAPTNPRDIREQQISHISRSLKRLAGKLKCPVLALSQLNEDGKVRESRSIAHDANLILKLERDEETIKMEVAKGRRVAKATYELGFNVQFCHVE